MLIVLGYVSEKDLEKLLLRSIEKLGIGKALYNEVKENANFLPCPSQEELPHPGALEKE